ncbi:MAG: VTT domain-containing protein [Nanoarchaeota archaeon]|nr:VTT domain-containing protein [Nanoarchaeota archaeon]
MGDYEFITVTSRREKVKVFLISIILLSLVAIITVYFWDKLIFYFYSALGEKSGFDFAKDAVTNVSLSKLFWISFLGGSIFIPMPIELFYWFSMTSGNGIFYSFAIALVGFVSIQLVNYWLGLKLSPFFLNFVSKRKIFKVRRAVNKYGALAVFVLNVVPSPSELLIFGLGVTKYNLTRLFAVLTLATAIKYGIMAIFYIIFY